MVSLALQVPYVFHIDHVYEKEYVSPEQTGRVSRHLRVCNKETAIMMVAARTEDYQLLGTVLDQGLKDLACPIEDLTVELLARDKQHVLELCFSK